MIMTNLTDYLIRKRTQIFDSAAFIAATVISLASCVGSFFLESNRPEFSTISTLSDFAMKVTISLIILYIVLKCLFNHFDYSKDSVNFESDFRRVDRDCVIKTALIFLLVWSTWILAHWPGTMRDDSIPQMFQALGYYHFYTQHPIMDTLFFGIFWKLGLLFSDLKLGLFLYIVVQAILTSFVFALIVSYLRMAGISGNLILCTVFFYAFSRAVYQPIDTMSKDAFNGYLFALVVLLQVDIVRTNGVWLNQRRCLMFYACAVFLCIASKRTMMYVLVPSAIFISIYLRSSNRHCIKLILYSILPALVFLFVWNPVSIAILDADSNPTYEMYSIPEQEVTACIIANPEVLNLDEYEELNQYMDSERAIQVYNPTRSDEVSGTVRRNPNKFALLKTWGKVLVRDPKTCLKSFLLMSGRWFSLASSIDYGHNMEEELLNPSRMQSWSSFFDGDVKKTEEVLQGLRGGSDIPLILSESVEFLDVIQRGLAPICSYGLFAFAIPSSILIYGISRREKKVVMLSIIPFLLLISFIVGPIALYWYSIPSVYIAPLILSMPLLVCDASGESKNIE